MHSILWWKPHLWLIKWDLLTCMTSVAPHQTDVCFFSSGKPSALYDATNPDWAPTLKLGRIKLMDSPLLGIWTDINGWQSEWKQHDHDAAKTLLQLPSRWHNWRCVITGTRHYNKKCRHKPSWVRCNRWHGKWTSTLVGGKYGHKAEVVERKF